MPAGTGRSSTFPRRAPHPSDPPPKERAIARALTARRSRSFWLQRTSDSPPVHRAAPLLRFLSPSALSAAGVLFSSHVTDESAPLDGHGGAASATFPSSGFLTLLTACSAHRLVGLFHPTSTHGVFALQSFLLPRSPGRLPATLAFLVLQPRPGRAGHLQGLAPRGSSLPACHVSTATAEPDALLGFLPSRALRSRRGALSSASSHPATFSEERMTVPASGSTEVEHGALGFA